MAAGITQICDPAIYTFDEALRIAKSCADSTPGFELDLVRSLHALCLSNHVAFDKVFRGLELLGGILGGETADTNRLFTLIRPFLKSSDPQIASKAVLILGRQSRNLAWLRNLMNETDERIRGNVIESLWNRADPEMAAVFTSALRDSHPRVVANAAYGLYLLNDPHWPEALDLLISHRDAGFRRSAIWILKSISAPESPSRLRPLIRDVDPNVRRAAFDALRHIRESPALRVA